MNEIEFIYIGWCNKTDKDGSKHDKVWTAFKVGNSYYAGWGARGKKLSFKKHDSKWSLIKVRRSKDKGHNSSNDYSEVDSFQLFSVFPFFKDEVEKYLTYAVLANKIK
jgi:hypothetical protein